MLTGVREIATQLQNDLTAVTGLALDDTLTFLEEVKDLPLEEWRTQVRATMDDIVVNYGYAAQNVSALAYDAARENSELNNPQNASVFANAAAFSALDIDLDDIRWLYTVAGGYNLVIGQIDNPEDFVNAFNKLSGITTKGVFNAGRDAISSFGAYDPTYSGPVRIARIGACGFCQMMSNIARSRESGRGFHDHCKCVVYPSFGSEKTIQFRDERGEEFAQRYKDIKRRIQEGEEFDSGRTLKRGTNAWEVANRKALRQKATEWRRDFAADKSKTVAEKIRNSTNREVDRLSNKLSSGVPLTERDKTILNGWGFDYDNISYKKPITSASKENVLKVMRQEFGYR